MFFSCQSLVFLDLTNFDTSAVTDMMYMFCQCSSLVSLDLNNFDTSSVTDMGFMFMNCAKLISLNLNNFNTSSIKYMKEMFMYCRSLVSLNLSNFDVNISGIYISDMFTSCNKKLKYCIDDNKNYNFIEQLKGYEKNCKEICTIFNSKKYIIDKNLCVNDCKTVEEYKYEHNNICYKNYSDYIYIKGKESNFIETETTLEKNNSIEVKTTFETNNFTEEETTLETNNNFHVLSPIISLE